MCLLCFTVNQVCFFSSQMHMYSLGMTLFWGADYEIPQSQVNHHHEYSASLMEAIWL